MSKSKRLSNKILISTAKADKNSDNNVDGNWNTNTDAKEIERI